MSQSDPNAKPLVTLRKVNIAPEVKVVQGFSQPRFDAALTQNIEYNPEYEAIWTPVQGS
jgi:hypothetical protein